MKRPGKIILPALVAVATLLILAPGAGPGESDGGIERKSLAAGAEKQIGVILNEEAQEASGIRTEVLQKTSYTPKVRALGRVLDLTPLVEVRTRFQAASGKAREAGAALTASQKEYDRVRELYHLNRNVSEKTLQAAKAVWEAGQARQATAIAAQGDIRDEARLRWGEPLAGWALGEESDKRLSDLLFGRRVLVEVIPPLEKGPQTPPKRIEVESGDGQEGAVQARFLSPSPRVDPALQGRSYFYLAPGSSLAAGMRVVAYLPAGRGAKSGVIIPAGALVWYAGRAWVYLRTGPEHFVRRPVATDTRAPGGWFVTDPELAGARVVADGAQLLFSEEFTPAQGAAEEDED
jgi:hypothetical protein